MFELNVRSLFASITIFVLILASQVYGAQNAAFDSNHPGLRQLPQGYWLSPMIKVEDVPLLKNEGIAIVISLVATPKELSLALEEAKIAQVTTLRMGNSFDPKHVNGLLEIRSKFRPEQIFIHCTHGADRTGAVAAFYLYAFEGWKIADAMASVVYPRKMYIKPLRTILTSEGVTDGVDQIDVEKGVTGIYATFGPHGNGGHKTTGKYGEFTRSTIKAMKSQQPINDVEH